ncbi:MAG: protein kinase [Acidobacteriota bacterium]|nr:protein kinase [Acidobacteriota bacterium]
MPSCPQCAASVAPTDRFCGYCGSTVQQGVPAASGDVVEPASASGSVAASAADAPPSVTTGEVSEGAPVELSQSLDAEPALDQAEALHSSIESPSLLEIAAGEDAPAESSSAGGGSAVQAAREEASPIAAETNAEAPTPFITGEQSPAGSPVDSAAFAASSTGRGGDESGRVAEDERARRYESTSKLRSGVKQLEPETILHSRYEIVRRVGGGGMGAVYLAKDHNLGDAPRAVKEMIQSQIDESQHEKAVNDFKRESMLLSSLEHPSIPTIYDYFYDEGANRFYLVMKYISGGDFLARLRNAPQGRIDEKTVTDWAAQIADVLEYLHRRNPPIIYRDLKPANLMIDGNSGRVMLIDFGIARWVSTQEKGVTAVGTMGYAPPELFSGKVEPRSDIYSLGATMFHLLTGADPQDNPLLIFDFHKHPRPRQIAPHLSNEKEAILMRAVEYKPESRFRSAGELRDTLISHLEKLRAGLVTYGQIVPGGHAVPKTVQTEMVYCGFCGGRIAADDVFCAHCGQRQPLAVASAALRSARATAKLVVMGTTELDSSFALHKENSLVGRSDPQSNIFPEVDLSRFDPQTKISRRHARIYRRGDVYLVEDLGSSNGTVINDSLRLAPHQPRALESGDKLRLGETTLHFLIS